MAYQVVCDVGGEVGPENELNPAGWAVITVNIGGSGALDYNICPAHLAAVETAVKPA